MTLDPVTVQQGKDLAEAKNLSVSGLTETLIEREYVRVFGKRKVTA